MNQSASLQDRGVLSDITNVSNDVKAGLRSSAAISARKQHGVAGLASGVQNLLLKMNTPARSQGGDRVQRNAQRLPSANDASVKATCVAIENDSAASPVRKALSSTRAGWSADQEITQCAGEQAVHIDQAARDPMSSTTCRLDVETQLVVKQYGSNIIKNMLSKEARFMADPNLMQKQPRLPPQMRGILYSGLIGSCRKCGVDRQIAFRAFNLTDRFLSIFSVGADLFPRVLLTSLFIVAKLETAEGQPFELVNQVAPNMITRHDIRTMEQHILKALGFNIDTVTSADFLDYFIATQQAMQRRSAERPWAHVQGFAWHVLEQSATEWSMLRWPPSELAAAAFILSNGLWGFSRSVPSTLASLIGGREESLEVCVSALHEMMLKSSPQSMLGGV